MFRILKSLIIIIIISYLTRAEIAIRGTVKKTDGTTGIPGVSVSLQKNPHLSVITNNNGEFSLTETFIAEKSKKSKKIQLTLNGRTLLFTNDISNKSLNLSLFSISGSHIFSKRYDLTPAYQQIIQLPRLCQGIYVLCARIEKEQYTMLFSSINNTLYSQNKSTAGADNHIPASFFKTTAELDTLIAKKEGYTTRKFPITNYKEQDISLYLDTITAANTTQAPKGCTIYFIRHAETVANASGQIGGGGPVEDHDTLTELGERQVEELKNFLIKENIRPDLIVVSPSWRTQKTIEAFLIAANLKGEIWVELNECCGQDPTGIPLPTERPQSRWKLKFALLSNNFIPRTKDDIYYWWPQSYEEGVFMVMTARKRLLENFSQSGKTVMVVGHAVNGGILLGLLRGYDMINSEPERPVYLLNTSIVKLTQDTSSGTFTLKQNINKPPTQ